MAKLKIWHKAQQYERAWWKTVITKIENGAVSQLDWYQWKARELEKRIARYVHDITEGQARVLEIGSGPIGIVNFLGWGERYAIDPLDDFYKESPTLTKLRAPGVTYFKGTGETLPFADSFFALVIIDNVIDHTHEPQKILDEIYRVLENSGVLYLAVNIHTRWGAKAHGLLTTLNIDKGHPYTFTAETIRQLLEGSGFKPCGEIIEDYLEAKRHNCTSKSMKDKIKGYAGISEFQYDAVGTKVL